MTVQNYFHKVMDQDIVHMCRNLTSIFGPERQEEENDGKTLNN
jgi:hypothetical protein